MYSQIIGCLKVQRLTNQIKHVQVHTNVNDIIQNYVYIGTTVADKQTHQIYSAIYVGHYICANLLKCIGIERNTSNSSICTSKIFKFDDLAKKSPKILACVEKNH